MARNSNSSRSGKAGSRTKSRTNSRANSRAGPRRKSKARSKRRVPLWRRVRKWVGWGALGFCAFLIFAVVFYALVNPPTTPYMFAEGRRVGGAEHTWAPLENISVHMQRSVVAAEDADFCNHWGFDVTAIRAAIDGGARRGGSTITQQVVKNAYLWQGRSWARKVLEAVLTPVVEIFWTKRRILEVYLNVAEFDEGVFGVEAAAQHYFGVTAADLTARQAARLAAILPSPQTRSASHPSGQVQRRAAQIVDGAATIRLDGRSACFES